MKGFLQRKVPSDQQMAPRHTAASSRDAEANWGTAVLGQILIVIYRKGKQNVSLRSSFLQIVLSDLKGLRLLTMRKNSYFTYNKVPSDKGSTDSFISVRMNRKENHSIQLIKS